MIHVALTPERIDTDKVISLVSGDVACGAIATFLGTTRAETCDEHGALVRLEYEAYNDMAEVQMQRLAQQATSQWSLGSVAMVHRTGSVPPGETSVAIAVAAAHRDEAFAACRWLIDTLKQDVPIWKKDVFADGYERWVQPIQ